MGCLPEGPPDKQSFLGTDKAAAISGGVPFCLRWYPTTDRNLPGR